MIEKNIIEERDIHNRFASGEWQASYKALSGMGTGRVRMFT